MPAFYYSISEMHIFSNPVPNSGDVVACYIRSAADICIWSSYRYCCSPVQWFRLRGRLFSSNGPSSPQCSACHRRVLLWLRFTGRHQLQPSPARFSPSERLPLWRRWPRYKTTAAWYIKLSFLSYNTLVNCVIFNWALICLHTDYMNNILLCKMTLGKMAVYFTIGLE